MTTGAHHAARAAAWLAVAMVLLVGCDSHRHKRAAAPPTASTPPAPASSVPAPGSTSSATPPPRRPSARAVANRRLAAIAKRLPRGSISVAALNVRTGATYRWGERRGMWTGSVYKLLVLEALLQQRQRAGSWLSSYEIDDITAMIEQSNNKAGYRMFLDAGGVTALAAAAHRIGLRHTRIGYGDPALSTCAAQDGLVLLRQLVTPGVLSGRSRRFVLRLMRNVQADQRWGVGAVADRGTRFANKNGWMQVRNNNDPGDTDDGRWLVNSIGIVRVHGQRLLMSIFTKHNPDYYTGVDLVDKLARIIAPTVLSTP